MKRLALSLAMLLPVPAAVAQPAPMTPSMTCAQAQNLVAARGMVLLYTSPRTWDQFVRDGSFCVRETSPRPVWVRTRDTPDCPLVTCVSRSHWR